MRILRLLAVTLLVSATAFGGLVTFSSTGTNVVGGLDQNYKATWVCPGGAGGTTSTNLDCVSGGSIGTLLPAYLVTVQPGSWIPQNNSPASKWISVDANAYNFSSIPGGQQNGNDPTGKYIFETWFNVSATELDPTLQFRFASDNALVQVFLNGQYTGVFGASNGSYSGWHSAAIDDAFLDAYGSPTVAFSSGLNRLDFVVNNENGPVGLRVESAVPEPGSLFLLGSGLIGAAGFIRRKFRA